MYLHEFAVGTVLPIQNLKEGIQFFDDNTSIWYEINYLRSQGITIVENDYQVVLNIDSPTVLNMLDSTEGSSIASNGEVGTFAQVSNSSTCYSKCNYFVYMMTGMMSNTNYLYTAAEQVKAQFPNVKCSRQSNMTVS